MLTLLSTRSGNRTNIIGHTTTSGNVHVGGGLNWGYNNGTTKLLSAYIPFNVNEYRLWTATFGPLPINNLIDVEWDDGTKMRLRFQVKRNGLPKQLSTPGDNTILGEYLRKRIGLKIGQNLIHNTFSIQEVSQLKKRTITTLSASTINDLTSKEITTQMLQSNMVEPQSQLHMIVFEMFIYLTSHKDTSQNILIS
ncbi:NgoFVII family restriction endonuclease [Erysipelothrix sp. D19-032]